MPYESGDSNTGAKLRAAIAHHRHGEVEAAIALYREIVTAHPDHTQALQLLGDAHLGVREVDAARECYRRILAVEPKNLHALESFGDAVHRSFDLDAARQAYAACLNSRRNDVRRLEDKLDTITFAGEHLRGCPSFAFRADLFAHALKAAPRSGLVLELGVARGNSLRALAALTPEPVYGFDSFSGLPTDWQPRFPAGTFAQAALPANLPANAELVIGLFADTLPKFAAEHPEPIRFLHVDCDLYASTKDAFAHLGDRLIAGSVIVFDEFFNYPGWREHEYRAFQEFIAETAQPFEYVGWIPGGMQVAVQLG